MILVKNLKLKFTKEFYALYDINLNIKKGESVALLGEKNSGKTTLIRTLCKLEKDYTGEIYIKDIPLKKIDFSVDIEMGYVPVSPIFLDKKTVYENLKYVLKCRKISTAQIEEKINNLLIEFNIEKLKDEKINKLTLFQKYLVSLARLSLRNLELVLIDNIFEELNNNEKETIIEIIKKYYLQNKTTLVIATSSNDIAKSLTKRIIKFKLGSIEE